MTVIVTYLKLDQHIKGHKHPGLVSDISRSRQVTSRYCHRNVISIVYILFLEKFNLLEYFYRDLLKFRVFKSKSGFTNQFTLKSSRQTVKSLPNLQYLSKIIFSS